MNYIGGVITLYFSSDVFGKPCIRAGSAITILHFHMKIRQNVVSCFIVRTRRRGLDTSLTQLSCNFISHHLFHKILQRGTTSADTSRDIIVRYSVKPRLTPFFRFPVILENREQMTQ
jgi:hypothetical protein